MPYVRSELLAEPEWLHEHISDPDLVIVDCPWDAATYGRAHIPGAICRPGHAYVKSQDEQGNPGLLLPEPSDFRKLAAELGIGPGKTVVVYDDWGSIFAARLWWVLRYYGHIEARILNGGWQGWVVGGFPVTFEASKLNQKETLTPNVQAERLATLSGLLENHNDGDWIVLDARSDDEYYGKAAHGNERVGHVPGAAHLEWSALLENGPDSEAVRRFRSAEDILLALDKAGVSHERTTVTYCQAAVRASFMAFVLELMGFPLPRVYDGSMAEWANVSDTPLE